MMRSSLAHKSTNRLLVHARRGGDFSKRGLLASLEARCQLKSANSLEADQGIVLWDVDIASAINCIINTKEEMASNAWC